MSTFLWLTAILFVSFTQFLCSRTPVWIELSENLIFTTANAPFVGDIMIFFILTGILSH